MRRLALLLCLIALVASAACGPKKFSESQQRAYDRGYDFGRQVLTYTDVSGQTPRQVRDFCVSEAVRDSNIKLFGFGCQDAINESLGQESVWRTDGTEY